MTWAKVGITEQDRKDLREFIRRVLKDIANGNDAKSDGNPKLNSWDAAYLLRVLAEPRLPKEPDEETLRWMINAGNWGKADWGDVAMSLMRQSYGALYAHLTKPAPPALREVDVWYVEYDHCIDRERGIWRWEVSVHDTEIGANGIAQAYLRDPSRYAEVKVTGPHKRRVPV